MDFECPRCHSFNTVPVASVSGSQTYRGSVSTSVSILGCPVGTSEGPIAIRSDLASSLRRPEPPAYDPPSGTGWGCLFIVNLLAWLSAAFSGSLYPTMPMVLVFTAVAVTVLTGLIWWLWGNLEVQRQDQRTVREAAYWSALAEWSRQRLCAQCGAVFIPTLPPAAGTTPLPAAPGQQIAPRHP